ncbi:MAG TPA: PIN domain-containing protein [Chloroflexota bacterium]|nr:PIN domain-containing protein [Chloroflexota bacterium]
MAGTARANPVCNQIIQQAERGQTQIVVSTLALAEVAKIDGLQDSQAEDKIKEFFDRHYVIPAAVDIAVADIARYLVRKYTIAPKLRPMDAIHIATAMLYRVPVLETFDSDLWKVSGQEGDPPILIQTPTYVGTVSMFDGDASSTAAASLPSGPPAS